MNTMQEASARWRLAAPSPDVARHVKYYVVHEPRPCGEPRRAWLQPARMRAVLEIETPSPGQCHVMLAGPFMRPRAAQAAPACARVDIVFRAGRISQLFDVSAAEMLDARAEAGGLFSRTELHTLAHQPGIAGIERVLRERVRAARAGSDLPDRLAPLQPSLHALPVAQLSERLNLTPRTAHRQFLALFGVSPRAFIRVARCEVALTELLRAARGEARTLAEVAKSARYADQAHLTREFRALVGLSPKQARLNVERAVPGLWAFEVDAPELPLCMPESDAQLAQAL